MTPKLDSQISQALQSHHGPLEVRDENDARSYVIVPKDDYRRLVEREFQAWLQTGLDQESQGGLGAWNLDEVLSEARRRWSARPATS